MSITEIIIKIGGCLLFLVGLGALVASVGFQIPFLPQASAGNPIVTALIGIAMIGFGIYIVRGGTPKV